MRKETTNGNDLFKGIWLHRVIKELDVTKLNRTTTTTQVKT